MEDWAAKAARQIMTELRLTRHAELTDAQERTPDHAYWVVPGKRYTTCIEPSERRLAAIIATFAEPIIMPLVTQLAEQRAELTGGLSELFKNIPACYDTPVDHYREMARRILEDRDALKHRERMLVALLRESKREHYECAKEGEPEDTDEECRCGADTWNARVDSALGGSALGGSALLGADVGPGAANGILRLSFIERTTIIDALRVLNGQLLVYYWDSARREAAEGILRRLARHVAPGAATGEGPGAYYGQPPKRS